MRGSLGGIRSRLDRLSEALQERVGAFTAERGIEILRAGRLKARERRARGQVADSATPEGIERIRARGRWLSGFSRQ
jgi:hypothetical protein